MNQIQRDISGDVTLQSVKYALAACYGSLADPDFRAVHAALRSPMHRHLIEELRAKGLEIIETTDENDDVSNQIVAVLSGDRVSVGLSGVGPFATIIHQAADGRYRWVTGPGKAPTPVAAVVASAVQQAGFRLLDRKTVARSIKMNRADGTRHATLYQALFTDTDRFP